MPATKSIPLAGGTLVLTTAGVNLFDASDAEAKLITDIKAAIKQYERNAAQEGKAPMPAVTEP